MMWAQGMWEIVNIVGLVMIICIAWLVWTERKSEHAFDMDAPDQSDGPHSAERRHYQERKRVVDQARAGTLNR